MLASPLLPPENWDGFVQNLHKNFTKSLDSCVGGESWKAGNQLELRFTWIWLKILQLNFETFVEMKIAIT